jgi:phosphoglycerol transferase MdoB-like AlkP superfamily enzyme
MGFGNGMEKLVTDQWPKSDLEMFQGTIPDLLDKQPFNAYYMTVSGHSNYTPASNCMTTKNWSYVKDLPYSTEVKGYLAANMELEHAMTYLVQTLEDAGIADDTVIVISTDHYPYGLTDSQYKGMLGHSIQYGGLERHRSDLIIWNSAMETVQINKPCSQQDVLPTLLNLFGFTYDSRLYSGMDILSDSYGLAMIANQSFITDKIIYNTRYEKVYYLDENWQMPEGYLDSYIQIVKNRFSIASNILNQNFFKKLPEDIIAAAQKGES